MSSSLPPYIIITGSTGFVGRALVKHLHTIQRPCIAAVRKLDHEFSALGIPQRILESNWKLDLTECTHLVHLAALAHQNNVTIELLDQVNVVGTQNLINQAELAGVQHFTYLSSIKVNGEGKDTPYTPFDFPAPEDDYGRSKFKAEQVVQNSRISHTILRPPLVYGPGVKGNFQLLLKLADLPIPLPLGGIKNMRSFIALENLVSALTAAIQVPHSGTYIVGDDSHLSTTELVQLLRKAFGRSNLLFKLPRSVVRAAAKVCGKQHLYQRLWSSLMIDDSAFRQTFNWEPTTIPEEAIREVVEWYVSGC